MAAKIQFQIRIGLNIYNHFFHLHRIIGGHERTDINKCEFNKTIYFVLMAQCVDKRKKNEIKSANYIFSCKPLIWQLLLLPAIT